MDAELRQVANGFDYKVRSFDKYDINGYRFRTYGKELSMADRKSTNCCVSAIGEGDIEYYGRVEAIYELQFYGENPPNVVVFRCYWFQPRETRRTHEHIGLVEIKQSTHLDVPDVYITAQQETQVVLDHLPPMMKENSSKKHVFPKKHFKNRSTPPQNIEVDNDSESDFTPEPKQEEVTAADDLSMLERLHKGGLPHVDAFIDDDDEHVTDSDDDDAFNDPGAYINDSE